MPNRVQTLRSNISGNRPPAGHLPGELYVNWPDGQLGVINAASANQDLIPVTFFSVMANYSVGNFVVQAGQLYRATQAVSAGAFNPAQWTQVGGSVSVSDTLPTNPQPGGLWWDSVGGNLYVYYNDGNSTQWVPATNLTGSASLTTSDTPPATPKAGDMWFDSVGGQLYIYFNDGSSLQWVIANNFNGGLYLPLIGGTLTGNLTVAPSSGPAVLTLTKSAAGVGSNIYGTDGGLIRWLLQLGDSTAESGSNAGSNFQITRYSDAGAALDVPLSINRATATVSFSGNAVVNGGLTSVAGVSPTLSLNKASGTGGNNAVVGLTAGTNRWVIIPGTATAESGGTTGVGGSDFQINRYNNAGTYADTPIAITRSTGQTTFSTAIVNGPSDRTLKENIKPLTGALDKVMKLNGVSFNFRGKKEKRIGLVAQDVAPILPEVIQKFVTPGVNGEEGEEKLAIDYPQLVALLIESIKTLTAHVTALEAGR